MFHPDDITPLDAREYVRREQGRFFNGGSYSPTFAATQIADEALLCGASEVGVSVSDGWLVIGADIDWLGAASETSFDRMVSFPEGGVNSFRSEILPAAFARSVVTGTPSGVVVVKGESVGPLAEFPSKWRRVVAFEIAIE